MSGVAVVSLAGVLISGCSPTSSTGPVQEPAPQSEVANKATAPFFGTQVSPPVPVPDLTLRDTDGQPFSFRARSDRQVLVIFFGYTHCPDLCPTTMADLAAAKRSLAPGIGRHVTIAFITEDPDRDSPAVLRTWLDQFDPGIVGLRGGAKRTDSALKALYLTESQRIESPPEPVIHPDDGHQHPGDYGLEHASQVYAFGPAGQTVLYTGGYTPDQYAHDFQLLAAASQ